MKALLVTSEFGTAGGGLSIACYKFKTLMETMGWEIAICLSPMNQYSNIDMEKMSVALGGYKKSLPKQLYWGGYMKNCMKEYADKNIDVILSFSAGENGYFASCIAETLGLPLIMLLRGSDMNLALYDSESWFYNEKALKRASVVVGLSNELVENAKKIYTHSHCKYFIIPNDYDLSSVISKEKSNKDKVLMGTGSRYLNEKKGIANLLSMVAVLNEQEEIEWHLELVGEVDEELYENYLQIMQTLKIQDYVHFIGHVGREQFKERIEQYNFYIQGSFFEGFSNSVAEVMTLGVPVMLTNTGYFAENFCKVVPEIIFDTFNPREMANQVKRYMRCSEKESLMQRAIQSVAIKVSRKTVIEEWKKVFESLEIPQQEYSNKEDIPAVMFHDLNNSYTGLDYAPSGFEGLVRQLCEKGVRLCSSKEYFEKGRPEGYVICTFDDGYEGVWQYAYHILKKYNFTATVFVCPDLIGEENNWNHKDAFIRRHMDERMLRELLDAGWEIGSHGLNHMNMKRYSETELERVLQESKNELENLFGTIDSFCYPFGEYNDFIMNRVQKYYKCAYATNCGGNHYAMDKYRIKRLTPEGLRKLYLL